MKKMKKMTNPFLSQIAIPKSLSFNLFKNTLDTIGNQDPLV